MFAGIKLMIWADKRDRIRCIRWKSFVAKLFKGCTMFFCFRLLLFLVGFFLWSFCVLSSVRLVMAGCGGCAPVYYRCITDIFENDDAAKAVLRRHGVLPSSVDCPRCQKPCNLNNDGVWRCSESHVVPKTRKRRYCGFRITDKKGTFLDHCHLPTWKVVLFVNHWINMIKVCKEVRLG